MVSNMRLKQAKFYHRFGVRNRMQIEQPRLNPISMFEFPLETIIHFMPEDSSIVGPSAKDPLFQIPGSRVFIEHVTELTSTEGNPRRAAFNIRQAEAEFRRDNRAFKILRKDNALTINPRYVMLINYGMLGPMHRYPVSFKANYNRWFNQAATMWNTVQSTHERFKWNQYIELRVPQSLPSYSQFRLMENSQTAELLGKFRTPDLLNIFDIYAWLGEKRQISNLSVLKDDTLGNINLFVRVKGLFFTLNLGLLNDWRKEPEGELDEGQKATGEDTARIQRRFFNLISGLVDLQNGVTELDAKDERDIADFEETIDDADDRGDIDDSDDLELEDLDLPDLPDVQLPKTVSRPELPDMNASDDDEDPVYLPNESLNDQLQEDLPPPTTEDVLSASVELSTWQLREAGLISAKAAERLVEEAKSYKSIPDPYGSKATVGDLLKIEPEDLAVPEVPAFADTDAVHDKSMLQSKLAAVQRKYIRDVLKKDVLNAVVAASQTQGVILKDHRVTVVRDAMNHYELHRVTLKPVRGKQSTVAFRIPVVDDDGRFVSNGVLCRMRLQRSDIPIRKVAPHRVALTSYYNKTFVERSQRRVNNLEEWLASKITDIFNNPEDNRIRNLHLAPVFDQSLHLPRIYSTLAKRFRQFETDAGLFYFDYHRRIEFFESRGLHPEDVETATSTLVGMIGKDPITVDNLGIFHRHVKGGKVMPIGTIYDITGIDQSSAPMDIAEMTVSNKLIPVGFVLAYQMGLDNLIDWLGCKVERHVRGKRGIGGEGTYTLTFQDEVLVFSRLDVRSSMIIAGLGRYHSVLKQYSVWDFNRKDVYYRLLSSVGLNVRYLREIESLFKSWIDPITRGLLEEMEEPTEFDLILLRATDLLMTDHSPNEVDGAYMRYRGYERMAGMIYGEISRACKIHNARAGTGHSGVELNPFVVWNRITTDAAVSLVEERNPIRDLREQEITTYRGDGGRSGQSMVERTRVYTEADVGVISESTVDSGDVGVISYMSPDPNLVNLRGGTRKFDKERDGVTKLFSTSTLLAPCADTDDTKRIDIQVPLGGNVH